MNSVDLKKIQSPLKSQYRENPESAIITLRAEGKIGEGISCKIETGRSLIEAGLHPAAGGNGLLACSGDLLLEALVACAGVTLSAVASSIDFKFREGIVKAEGVMDFRGTLAVAIDAPVGFKSIRLIFELDCDENEDKIQTLLKLTERYCVVYRTLVSGTNVTTGIEKLLPRIKNGSLLF